MDSTAFERHGSDCAPESTNYNDCARHAAPMVRMPRRPSREEDTFVYVAERKASDPYTEYQRIDGFNDSRQPSRSTPKEHLDVVDGPAKLDEFSSPTPTAEDFPKPPLRYSVSPYPPPFAPLPKLPTGIKSSEAEDRSEKLKELIWRLLWDPGMKSALANKDKSSRDAILHTVVILLATSPGTSDHARKEVLKICSVPSSRQRTEVDLGLAIMTRQLGR